MQCFIVIVTLVIIVEFLLLLICGHVVLMYSKCRWLSTMTYQITEKTIFTG